MSVAVRNWKRGAARLQGVQWQDNFLIIAFRSKSEAQETWHYIRLNPVVKGLCEKERIGSIGGVFRRSALRATRSTLRAHRRGA